MNFWMLVLAFALLQSGLFMTAVTFHLVRERKVGWAWPASSLATMLWVIGISVLFETGWPT